MKWKRIVLTLCAVMLMIFSGGIGDDILLSGTFWCIIECIKIG